MIRLHQRYVDHYINLYESGEIKLNKKRVLLVEYLKRDILTRKDIYFDDKLIEDCIAFGEKWYFPLEPFQKFLIAFVFLFWKKNNRCFYRKYFWFIGRGAGKNGLISVVTHFLISELHGIEEYNITVVANSEDQAKTSPDEVKNTVRKSEVLQLAFKTLETQTMSYQTGSILKFRTSNGETKDGLRDGAVVFDEIHQYENNKDVRVHISGLGKKPNPREFYIGTDGYIREGFLDDLKKRAERVLKGEARPNSMFPFMCELDGEEEVEEPTNWEKANPMLCEPRGEYAQGLFDTIMEEYEDLEEDPSMREEFMTKRMNQPVTDLEKSVAKWEEIAATNQPLPDLHGRECIGCLDYASIRDFAACGLVFKHEGKYPFITHSFTRKEFVDKYYGYSKKVDDYSQQRFAPIKEWEQRGLLTVLNDTTIKPQVVVDWFVEMRKHYYIKKIIGDNYRMEVLKESLEQAGFEVEIIRNPRAIHGLLAPRVETGFAKEQFIFGDNPLMRWYTNNVLVKIKPDGNKEYLKKEPVRRKTDGFQAFVYGLYRVEEISDIDLEKALDALTALNF